MKREPRYGMNCCCTWTLTIREPDCPRHGDDSEEWAKIKSTLKEIGSPLALQTLRSLERRP